MQRSSGMDRPLAWAGLLANGAALAGLPLAITLPGPLATARLVVGLAAVLPALVVALVACGGLLAQRQWGRTLALVALGLGLAVALAAGIVWLALVPALRGPTAAGLGGLWLLQLVLLIRWCLPPQRNGSDCDRQPPRLS
jgi:hypothetical protein